MFATAERMLRLGLVDAAVVGGVDTLCGSVLFGFNALQLVSPEPCRPFDAERSGISIGEAAGFALLERDDGGDAALRLLGYGESSDAHHMSTPHPEGLGAERALDDALARAGIDAGARRPHQPARHGEREERRGRGGARRAPLSGATHASSTKGITGHTLGAAGIVEAAASLLAIEHGLHARHRQHARPRRRLRAADPHRRRRAAPVRIALSNSFGFGGNNCVLVFGGGDADADARP